MRRMAMILALLVPCTSGADDKAKRVAESDLSGTWIAIDGEAQGVQIPKDQLSLEWTFRAGGKATLTDRKRGTESPFAFTLDAAKKPHSIDVTYTGPIEALKNSKQFGIYKIEKDTLTLCLSPLRTKEKDRPTEFSGKAKGTMLMRFERKKEK